MLYSVSIHLVYGDRFTLFICKNSAIDFYIYIFDANSCVVVWVCCV